MSSCGLVESSLRHPGRHGGLHRASHLLRRIFESEDSQSSDVVRRRRQVHNETAREKVAPKVVGRGRIMDQNIREGRRRVRDVRLAREGCQKLTDLAVNPFRFVVRVRRVVFVEILLAGVDGSLISFIVYNE